MIVAHKRSRSLRIETVSMFLKANYMETFKVSQKNIFSLNALSFFTLDNCKYVAFPLKFSYNC